MTAAAAEKAAIARQSKIDQAVISVARNGDYLVVSSGTTTVYSVYKNGHSWGCTCKAYEFGTRCWHIECIRRHEARQSANVVEMPTCSMCGKPSKTSRCSRCELGFN